MRDIVFWQLKPGQDTADVELGFAKEQPDQEFVVPLNVIASQKPFTKDKEPLRKDCYESVRFFRKSLAAY